MVLVALAPRQDQAVRAEVVEAQTAAVRGLQVELELLAALSSRHALDTTAERQTDQAVRVVEEGEEALLLSAQHRPERPEGMAGTGIRGRRITSRTLAEAVEA